MSKPLQAKAYGHIGHLPGSRMGPADHQVHAGQARIATEKGRDRHDRVLVQEKLDGSCVAIARIDGELVALQRKGYTALSSPFEQHHLFDAWVHTPDVTARLDEVVREGERLVGEWLALAHGTRYDLGDRDPFVAFDLMTGPTRMTFDDFVARTDGHFETPALIWEGPTGIEHAMELLGEHGFYGSLDPVEGAVWRVERRDPVTKILAVDFLCKYVRPDKVDGSYLGNISGGPDIWNWRPA